MYHRIQYAFDGKTVASSVWSYVFNEEVGTKAPSMNQDLRSKTIRKIFDIEIENSNDHTS